MPLRALITVFFSALVVQLSMAQQRFPPSPYDGEDGLKSLVEREMVYPRKALRDSTEGMVNLLFVVDRDGSIKGLKVWQSLSPETDAEAIRVFNKVQWHPARVGSMTMASEHYMRVEFSMRKYRSAVMNRGYDTLPAIVVPIDVSEIIWRAEDIDTVATPVVPGEFTDLTTYLSSMVNYPDDAFNLNMEGRVELEFVVEQHGGEQCAGRGMDGWRLLRRGRKAMPLYPLDPCY